MGVERHKRATAIAALERRFEAAVFDWDGTAVPDRTADATAVRLLIEELCARGFDVGIVSGTNVDNVDGQLRARPEGPGRLYLCLNRGSEVFEVGPAGPDLVHRRLATPEEDEALTRTAEQTVERLAALGLHAEIVSQRLNRRKIDLIPEPQWADPPKARISELLAAVEDRLARRGLLGGLPAIVELARAASLEAGLSDPRITTDAKHVEIGLTDKADSAKWLLERLWLRGIGPRGILVAGDEFGPLGGVRGSDAFMLVAGTERATVVSVGAEPLGVPDEVIHLGGGPERFLELLADQLERRRRGELPTPTAGVDWLLTVESLDPRLERAHESLLTLADGRIGTTGAPIGRHPAAAPSVLAAGLYDGEGPETALLRWPVWNVLEVPLVEGDSLRRVLDLRTGVLFERLELARGDKLDAVLLSSLARPGTCVLRARGASGLLAAQTPLEIPEGTPWEREETEGAFVALARATSGGGAVAAYDRRREGLLDRLAAHRARTDAPPPREEALAALEQALDDGFEHLLVEHREAWAKRWDSADVVVDGDPELQLALRFAVFHLIASAADSGEAPVGARGLTGHGYRGHVFWDAEVFVLPFLAATHPEAARAMLEYRLRRLPAAREAARQRRRAGARFPWESAHSGFDVTPPTARDRTGKLVPIRTGELEEHITADVAWASAHYVQWTGDEEFAAGPGRELLVETARYWASRIRLDDEGRAHVYGVIGPDEYHEPVDDNAFTNVMARWNLRAAAQAARSYPGPGEEEAESWERLADALVDGYDPASGLYEQFAGFWELEPIVIAEIARRPIVADALLGRERVQQAQVLKQADVLMLHYLVPEEVAEGSLEPNLSFYEPRTAHGSSLSPGVHAALFARAGRFEEALEALWLTSRIDLDDLTHTTATGLHVATLGSLWRTLAFGFAGLRPAGETLRLEPVLPERWRGIELRLRFRGSRVQLRLEHRRLVLRGDPPARISVVGKAGALTMTVPPRGVTLEERNGRWEVAA